MTIIKAMLETRGKWLKIFKIMKSVARRSG